MYGIVSSQLVEFCWSVCLSDIPSVVMHFGCTWFHEMELILVVWGIVVLWHTYQSLREEEVVHFVLQF